MNSNDFEYLLQLVLDGEADEAECRRFEAALAASAEFRARLDFEKSLRQRLSGALTEKPDMVARGRLLAGLHAALAAEVDPGAGAEPVAAEVAVGVKLRRFIGPAAVAAALLLAFWLGGRSGADSDQPRREGPRRDSSLQAELDAEPGPRDIISAINVSETHFREEVAAERERVGCPRRSAENCLDKEPGSKVWKSGCGVDCAKRMAEARAMAARCIGDDLEGLGLPDGFELVGCRMATIRVGEETVSVPHLVFISDQSRISAYVLCDSQCATITTGLHRLDSDDSKGDGCLWGCPQRGLVVRRCGKAWIALSADMGFDQLAKIASDF